MYTWFFRSYLLTSKSGFLEALSSDKVTLYSERIQEIVSDGFIDSQGQKHEVDVIICATGCVVFTIPNPMFFHLSNVWRQELDRYDTSYISKIPMHYDGKNLQDIQKSRDNVIHYMGIAERTFENLYPHQYRETQNLQFGKLRCQIISFMLDHTQDTVMGHWYRRLRIRLDTSWKSLKKHRSKISRESLLSTGLQRTSQNMPTCGSPPRHGLVLAPPGTNLERTSRAHLCFQGPGPYVRALTNILLTWPNQFITAIWFECYF